MEDKRSAIRPVKIHERFFYIVIIVGLVMYVLFQHFDNRILTDDNKIIVQKSEVLNNYTNTLNKIIHEKETVLKNTASSDQATRKKLQRQIRLLNEKKQEVAQLQQSRQLDFQKLIKISAELEQMHKKDEALQAQLASYQDSLGKNTDFGAETTTQVSLQEYQILHKEFNRLQDQLQAVLEKNSRLSGKLFATHFMVRPGEIKRGKFSRSTKARRTTRLQVEYKLTRRLQPGEKLVAEVFNNGALFPVKEVYRNELQSGNRVTMNLAHVQNQKFKRGNNTLNINVIANGQKSKVGSYVLYLR